MSETQNNPSEQAGVSLDSAVRAMLAPVEAQLARLEGQLQGSRASGSANSTASPDGEPTMSASAPGNDQLEANLLAKIDACHADLLTKLTELLSSQSAAVPSATASTSEPEDDLPEFPESFPETFPEEPAAPVPVVAQAAPVASAYPSAGGNTRQFAFALLGPLADEPSLDVEELLSDLSRGDLAAQAFVGQLLLARSSDSVQLAPLLKDLGEAYYRWRPRRTAEFHPSELVIAQWLVDHMAEVGLTNKIELVRIGDRFDQSRHRSDDRGVEVVGVHGWVVLRENGKVYTKAQVSVA